MARTPRSAWTPARRQIENWFNDRPNIALDYIHLACGHGTARRYAIFSSRLFSSRLLACVPCAPCVCRAAASVVSICHFAFTAAAGCCLLYLFSKFYTFATVFCPALAVSAALSGGIIYAFVAPLSPITAK